MPRGVIALIALLAVVAFPAAATGAARKAPKTRSVLYVGNNWDGTADVIQPRRFKNIARINIIPDIEERMKEIESNPERLGYFLAIRGDGAQHVAAVVLSASGRRLFVEGDVDHVVRTNVLEYFHGDQ